MGYVEADTWGFLDKRRGDATPYLSLGCGRGSPAFHSGVCLGVAFTPAAARQALGLLYAATGSDADIDAAISALPGYAVGPWPDVSGATWWATVPEDVKSTVREWLRDKAKAIT
jgi:hypothetical protein